MFDLSTYEAIFETWLAALKNPEQFLSQPFAPDASEFTAGIEFYLHVLAASVAIYGLIIIFVERGSLEIKARMLANSLLGVIFLFVFAAVVHFPFWMLGGQGTFTGTLLAYIYAATPYGPLTAIGMWILIAAMPVGLRRFAINPATAKEACKAAGQDPQTDKFVFIVGTAILFVLMFWTAFVAFRYLSFAHDLHSWRLALAILVSLIIWAPLNKIFQAMGMLVSGSADTVGAPSPAAVSIPGSASIGGPADDGTG